MLVPTSLPVPGIVADRIGDAHPASLFAIRIDSAVNLLEDREYAGLQRNERILKALADQQSFLNGLLDPSLKCAFDLRFVSHPDSGGIDTVLLGRTWGSLDPGALAERTEGLVRQVHAMVPRHVHATAVADVSEVGRLFWPFEHGAHVETASVHRREIIGTPSRPDAGVGYYFSVVPFNWMPTDWMSFFASMAAAPTTTVASVGLLPIEVPTGFTQNLNQWATFFSRLAKEDKREGGLYHGQRTVPADAFAVEAERTYQDLARRYERRGFVMRIQVAAEGRLPPALVESFAATVSPTDQTEGRQSERQRAASSFEIRRPTNDFEHEVAHWNLRTVDFRLQPGRPEIWARPDRPTPELQLLTALGDARDANCAFRFPVAVDGTLPGVKVRRGRFGHEEAYGTAEPSVTVGYLPGTDQPIRVGLRGLTKHALISGSTGSGKTTTVLELLRQLWVDHGVPFLVIEPVNSDANDYRRLLAEPGFEALEVVTVGDESSRPLRFNPFEVPDGVIVAEHTANLLACFKAAFGLWEPLPGIYQDALNLTYLRAGILASERSGGVDRQWPTAVEFMRSMSEVTEDLGYAGEVKSNIEAASIRRAQQLATGVAASAFLTNLPNDIGSLMDRPVILELKTLGAGDEQALMIALLLNAMTEHYQAVRGATPHLTHVTVVEEAHRLLARPQGGKGDESAQAKEKAAEAFANTLAENRKYGEGVIIAEQIPTKLVDDAVKNTNLKVMHRLTADEDRRYLGETMGLDDSQQRFATRLGTGEGLTYSDEFAEAVLVDVRPKGLSAAPVAPPRSDRPPFAACGDCRAKCRFRGAALALVRDRAAVQFVTDAVASLEELGVDAGEQAARWDALVDGLRQQVLSFPALPSEEPSISHAAYCFFLHALGVRTMRFSPAWPPAVAERLGLVEAV